MLSCHLCTRTYIEISMLSARNLCVIIEFPEPPSQGMSTVPYPPQGPAVSPTAVGAAPFKAPHASGMQRDSGWKPDAGYSGSSVISGAVAASAVPRGVSCCFSAHSHIMITTSRSASPAPAAAVHWHACSEALRRCAGYIAFYLVLVGYDDPE